MSEEDKDLLLKDLYSILKDFVDKVYENAVECIDACLKKQGQGQVKESSISKHEIETCKENNGSLTSEDEKIRKELIRAFKSLNQVKTWNGIERTKILALLEKQGEQKPADEVKLKFEIEKGKWYVCTQTYTLRGKIVVIKGQTYLSNQDGAIEGEDRHLFIDKIDGKALNYFKPWTIKDAKDGDVFADMDRAILLFRGVGNNEWSDAIDYYALLETNMNNRFSLQEGDDYWGRVDYCSLCPATKEQRELLFQKMKEAEYEWDAEKKELRKIEQNLAEQNVDSRKLCNIVIEELSKYSGNEVCKAPWALDSTGVQYPLYFAELGAKWQKEQKPTWNEEDDNCLSTIIAEFSKCSGKSVSKDEWMRCNDFLNSIKDRVQPQPKQEWSEEDECRMNNLCHFLEEYGNQYYGYLTLQGTISWLKALKSQKQ